MGTGKREGTCVDPSYVRVKLNTYPLPAPVHGLLSQVMAAENASQRVVTRFPSRFMGQEKVGV